MGGAWGYVASPATSLIVGIIVALCLIPMKRHTDHNGRVHNIRFISVFGLSAAAYTFLTCAGSQIFIHGPSVGTLIDQGFGAGRVGYLLLLVAADDVLRVWGEFRNP